MTLETLKENMKNSIELIEKIQKFLIKLPSYEIIKERRKELKISQQHLAKICEVSQSVITKFEGGKCDINYKTYKRIVEYLWSR